MLNKIWIYNDDDVVPMPVYNVIGIVDNLNQNDGVLAYIDNALAVSCIQLTLGGVGNCLALTFNLQGHPCELIAAYRSPSSNLSLFL